MTLSQLVAFISFQSRLLRGFRLLGGEDVPAGSICRTAAAAWRTEALTLSGQQAPPLACELELPDLIQSTVFFAWANRLMLTLGEPFTLAV